MKDRTVTFVNELPVCDICVMTEEDPRFRKAAQFDGKTIAGSWAFMCPPHFQHVGIGLGEGKGQKLLLKTPTKGATR